MSSLTTRLGLYKPDSAGTEFVNVVTDLNNNFDSLDAKIGAFACTSATRPGSPYNGQMIRETDTGKVYLWDGASWKQLLYHTAQFGQNIITTGKLQTTGASAGLIADVAASGSSIIFNTNVTGDTADRARIYASGLHEWGPGNAALDTNLYRGGSNLLKTDDAFQVVGALTVGGSSSFADVNISGNLNLGSATYDTQLSTGTNVSNTTAETNLAQMSIPAASAVVGAVYRIRAWGTLTVTGTPTITFRANISGSNIAAFPAVTVRSGATDGFWDAEYYIVCTATGVTGTFSGFAKYTHNFLTSATTYTPIGPVGSASITRDTTGALTMNFTAQWSAASASNSCFLRGFAAERVA